VSRFDAEGLPGLHDRSSRPHRVANRTAWQVEAAVVGARRRLRAGPAFLAEATGVPERTVTRILRRCGEPVLAVCDPLTGAVIRAARATWHRYERDVPGELIHVDVKKIGRIPDGGGWRAHGRGPRPGATRSIGYDYVHAAVDDHSRIAYAEILIDEKGATCAGFLARAAAFFAEHGAPVQAVMTDNAMNYRLSRDFAATLSDLGAAHLLIKPLCPWQNGKVERFNRTLQIEWAYRQVFTSNADRTHALRPWLQHYNHSRRHSALGAPPASRLSPTC
jgi:transposase InsO family protein